MYHSRSREGREQGLHWHLPNWERSSQWSDALLIRIRACLEPTSRYRYSDVLPWASPDGVDVGGGGRGSRSGEMIIGHLSQLQGVVEILPAQEQAIFVASFIPWALKILTGTAIKMLEGSVEHRLRHGVLVTLKTMSGLNEPLRPFLDQLLPALCGILQEDNEENAIVAVHIIIDLNKVHRLLLEPYAQTLVDFVLASFEAFPDNCEAVFEVTNPVHA